jgi:hypothetical protein
MYYYYYRATLNRPPTDRPPDRPDRGRGVSGGCSQERANTRGPVVQLASSLSLAHSLSGKSAPFAANANLGVQKPSDCQVPSQVGSSHEVNRGLSWMLPRCGRFRVKRDMCVTNCHPSSKLGRNLFPPRWFSYHTRFSGFNRTVGRVTCRRVQGCTTWLRPPGRS